MALNPALIYDPRFHTFESWASLMCEQYGTQNLEIPNAYTDWKVWGDGLSAIDVFSNEATPRTDQFEDWYDWAEAMVNAINPYTAST